ncbi:ABC transporter substrate-binding protein [Neomoorella mulderi]|uniref:Putative 2-aminoethylphosphonate-binding periplasmic protein n=1 Tax=Moorella mulderi DSM 14980 TaxID=1122241 RepID=A0A151AW08_9FIRM|nr:ABC transporter substrate-binding protein [Moorella mulderi]KYH31743.1 putative 2-aminoethylphosphonate-binding periplasmic protein precursor [Moorella mulderi DSM 14980]
MANVFKYGKKALMAALLLILIVVTSACSSKVPAQGENNNPGMGDSNSFGKMVLYTSQPQDDVTKLLDGFKAKYPGVDVQVFRSGTEEVISRFTMEAQGGKPQADVLFLADAPTFQRLKDQGFLEAYTSPELNEINPDFVDPDHMYTGTKLIATGIVYNTSAPKPEATWQFLLSEQAKNKVVMPSPFYSGAAAFNLSVLTRESFAGWNFFEKLKANGVQIVKGNGDVKKMVASGEKPYGILINFEALKAKKQGSPVDFVYPREGLPVITEPVAIVKGAPHPEMARKFVDFVLSKDGQQLAAKIGFYMPVRKDVPPPEGYPPLSEIKFLQRDPKELALVREDDKKKFADLFNLPK